LGALAWARPLPATRRAQIALGALALAVAVFACARLLPVAVRDWLPGLFLILGYYLSGRFFVRPSAALEAWLMRWDRRLLGDPTTRFARWPRPLLAYLEIVYMGCAIVIPAGCAALYRAGHAAVVDRYWAMVLAAEFAA